MGVWIETPRCREPGARSESHPVWVCGLKRLSQHICENLALSHPVWVCGLKQEENQEVLREYGHTLYGCVD